MTFEDIQSLKIGTTDVSAAYIGATQVYGGGTTTPPPSPVDSHYYDYVVIRSLADNNDITINGEIEDLEVAHTGDFTTAEWGPNSDAYFMPVQSPNETISMMSGDTILLRRENSSAWGETFVDGTDYFEVEGNIMTLIYGQNYTGQTSLYSYSFNGLFSGCTNLVSAENLVLPATTLARNCYSYMFSGCTSLTTAPETIGSSATTMSNYSCVNMFRGCSSLTTTPALPATTLTRQCYYRMFYGCTSITTAPVLPATTLANQCYQEMFKNCTSLSAVTCLATDITSYTDPTTDWLSGVASSGTFTKASSMTGWTTGVDGIPSGWTVQDYTAEEEPQEECDPCDPYGGCYDPCDSECPDYDPCNCDPCNCDPCSDPECYNYDPCACAGDCGDDPCMEDPCSSPDCPGYDPCACAGDCGEET